MSRPWLIAIAGVSLIGSGCDSTPMTPAEPPGPVTAMRLRFGPNQTGVSVVTLNADGTVSGAPARLEEDYYSAGDPNWMESTLLNAAGSSLPWLADYELRATPADTTLLSFTPTSALEGLLVRKRSGGTSITFVLIEKSIGRVLLGPYQVPFIVER
jgi:hypothetical protein